MNNRGKPLSNLELLKNRLIYLTTLFSKDKLGSDDSEKIRKNINDAWKEVYKQLGRNADKRLDDDEFLRAHWIMYFEYNRSKKDAYRISLLDEKFIQKEVRDDKLSPQNIKEYVKDLESSAGHWFNLHYPDKSGLSDKVKAILQRLNRIGMGEFRPLVMSILKNVTDEDKNKKEVLEAIERFIFIVIKLSRKSSNYSNSTFYKKARDLNKEDDTNEVLNKIKKELKPDNKKHKCLDTDENFDSPPFYDYLNKQFMSGKKEGYYGWPTLKYFLYEYELYLASELGFEKTPDWDELLKTPRDKLSIEHIFPQNPKDWKEEFIGVSEGDFSYYSGSIGNLLLLSKAINSSFQNKPFAEKKKTTRGKDGKNSVPGYEDGSRSEREVSKNKNWTPAEIKERGLKLLEFMETKWEFKFKEEDKEKLLFLPDKANDEVNSN